MSDGVVNAFGSSVERSETATRVRGEGGSRFDVCGASFQVLWEGVVAAVGNVEVLGVDVEVGVMALLVMIVEKDKVEESVGATRSIRAPTSRGTEDEETRGGGGAEEEEVVVMEEEEEEQAGMEEATAAVTVTVAMTADGSEDNGVEGAVE